jgi:hypothetical protein
MTRKFTNKLLEAMDEGLINSHNLARNLLGYMSERDVQRFVEAEGYFDHEDELSEDEEHDAQSLGPDPDAY